VSREASYQRLAHFQAWNAQQRREREQRQAEADAATAAAIRGVFADLSNSAQRSAYDMQRSAVINQQAMQSPSGGNSVAPPMTYDQWTSYQQSQANRSQQASTSSARNEMSTSSGARRDAPSDDTRDATMLTQDQVRALMWGPYSNEQGLEFYVGDDGVFVTTPDSLGYRQHEAGMVVLTDMVETSFRPTTSWAQLQGQGTCSQYVGEQGVSPDLGGRRIETGPCVWTFIVSPREGERTFGTTAGGFQGTRPH
jgi:hypothetical protein